MVYRIPTWCCQLALSEFVFTQLAMTVEVCSFERAIMRVPRLYIERVVGALQMGVCNWTYDNLGQPNSH